MEDDSGPDLAAILARRNAALTRNRTLLRAQTARFDAVLENMAHGVSLYDGRGRLVICNSQFLEIYRLPASCGRAGTSFRRILAARVAANTHSGSDPDAYVSERMALVEKAEPSTGAVHLNTGQVISVTHQPLDDGGWVSTHKDITELHHMQAELLHLAYHDTLTDLPNRNFMSQKLRQAYADLGRTGGFAVLCLDLDGFKAINDTLGHSAGDQLLRQVAQRLRAVGGANDLIGRMGGDEFAMVHVSDALREGARGLARKICDIMRSPFELDGQLANVAVSVGIALAPSDGIAPDALLKSGDLALYAAKKEQRGGYRFFQPEMGRSADERRRLETELRLALENGEFELYYQPVLDLAAQQITGFEALLRWHHPKEGLVEPAGFLPLAEELGLIVPIGEWVIREALAEAARWPGEPSIAVNVSPSQFGRGNLLGVVMNALAASGLPHRRIEIEITESVLLGDTERNLEILQQLRALGVKVVLDDFGTGYSALSYLLQFPFDKIKLDCRFVRALEQGGAAEAIVRAVADIGRHLAITTTAEGVETAKQLRAVHRLGYAEAQGYLIAPPMNVDGLRRMLDDAHDAFDVLPSRSLAG